jgi:type III secretion system YscD/HrpQ family protein
MKIEPHLETLLPQLELRVLHGPQSGSRLTLSVGEYLLGTDDECDVMLAGPRLKGTHAKLKIDGDLASIGPVDGGVLDAHGSPISEDAPLALGMPVELGGIWISIDEVDAPWPSTEALIPQPSPAPASPAVAETSAATFHEAPLTQEETDLISQRAQARRVLIFSLIGLATIAVLGIAGALWLVNQPAHLDNELVVQNAEPPASGTLSERLTEAFPGREIRVTSRNGGVLQVTAYASDKAMANRIQMLIRKYDNTAVTLIYQDDVMQESATTVVQKYRQEGTRAMVQIVDLKNGVANLRGVVVSKVARDELLENLRSAVPGLRSVDASLQTTEELPSLLSDRLNVADLSKKFQILSKQPEFTVRGSLTEEELRRWETLLVQFDEEFGRLLPIRAIITVQQKRPPINIQTVVSGAMPFVITDTGQRLGVGGEANGHTITAIRDDEVIFDGTLRYRLPR